MKRIMVFAPHPDDDVLGCGGSLAKSADNGDDIFAVYMTSGESGSLNYSKDELALKRENETRLAANRLGYKELIFLRNSDGYLEYDRQTLIALTNLIREKQPAVVYLPHRWDLHEDHQTTFRLVMEACQRSAGPWFQECRGVPWRVPTILGYEVWTPIQEVSWVEDITPYMDIKIDALKMHLSQLQTINYDEAVRGLNAYRGIMSGKGKYCECFQIIKAQLF